MKKEIHKIMLGILVVISLYSCEIGRFVVFNVPDVKDYKLFPYRTIANDSVKFNFISQSPLSNDSGMKIKVMQEENKEVPFDSFLEAKKTLAFLVIHDDTMVYENYFNQYDQSSVVPSFSVAKAVISTLIGCAIDDGYISSVDQPITDFIPEMRKNGFEKVKIKHLLQMTSGIDFKESCLYLNNSIAEFYYGINIREKAHSLRLKAAPGEKFEYASGNTQLLGMILERALVTKTVAVYLQERIWQPLGMEYEATWSLDRERNGCEKTFCCLNARARDFAKIGRLYMNKGNWNGRQIISEEWVNESTKVDTTEGGSENYKYQWWIASEEGDFYARGMLGQYIYVNPDRKLIIVRLGEKGAGIDWPKMFISIAEKFKNKSPEEFYIVESRVN
jgi:CubicO group peptidase (beta-lactamase class C family)